MCEFVSRVASHLTVRLTRGVAVTSNECEGFRLSISFSPSLLSSSLAVSSQLLPPRRLSSISFVLSFPSSFVRCRGVDVRERKAPTPLDSAATTTLARKRQCTQGTRKRRTRKECHGRGEKREERSDDDSNRRFPSLLLSDAESEKKAEKNSNARHETETTLESVKCYYIA